jgi:PleD family two-component response regulator
MRAKPLRILLIDGGMDDPRWIQELILEMQEGRFGRKWMRQFELIHVDWLASAVEALRRDRFDAALLNPALPDSQGIHSLLLLKAEIPDLPVIILSDHDDEDLAISLLNAGAQDFLVKSEVDGVPLARAVRLAVERDRREHAVRGRMIFDELTGLYNRAGFLEVGQHLWTLAARLGERGAALAMQVQGLDELSHLYGKPECELACIEIADVVRDTVHEFGPIARLAKDRFCQVMVGVDQPGMLAAAVERAFSQYRQRRVNRKPLTLSIETVAARFGECSFSDFLATAESSLCDNKLAESKALPLPT